MDQQGINNWLKDNVPKCDNGIDPLFRLVWADDQREWRTGTFNEYSGPIFLRTFTGTRLTKKYFNIHERWILEQRFPPTMAFDPSLPNSRQGSYECIYVFESGKGDSLPLSLRVVDLIVSIKLNRKPTKQQIHDAIAEQMAKSEVDDYFESELANMSVIGNALRMREAVGYNKALKGTTEYGRH
jgi:hypothetical protein